MITIFVLLGFSNAFANTCPNIAGLFETEIVNGQIHAIEQIEIENRVEGNIRAYRDTGSDFWIIANGKPQVLEKTAAGDVTITSTCTEGNKLNSVFTSPSGETKKMVQTLRSPSELVISQDGVDVIYKKK